MRAEQAGRTRGAVLDAAAACFSDSGYTSVTMKQIAARAGVAVETVYAQGTKGALLLAVVDRVLVGDDEPVPVMERPVVRAALAASDAHEVLDRLGPIAESGLRRAMPVMVAFAGAAGADAEIAAAYADYEGRRHADATVIARALAPGLRADVTAEHAADVLWLLIDPVTAHQLVGIRGWDERRWTAWFVDSARRLLLD